MRVLTALLLVASASAQAHGLDDDPTSRAGNAFIVVAIVASALAYLAGSRALSAHRGARARSGARDALWFTLGLAVLAAALLGPLDEWSTRSFAVHMVQHEILMLIVAPLLVLGRPLARWTWMLPRAWRVRVGAALRAPAWRTAWGAITGVAGACALQTAALWAWHLPAWFRAALEHPGIHILQHATFLATALCFWWSVLRPAAARSAAARGIATLFVTTLTTGALGALLTFGSSAWYAVPGQDGPFGWTTLEDQQLGGLIMWIPGGTVYVVIALVLGARALLSRGVPAARIAPVP
jgi:putative membrane protein